MKKLISIISTIALSTALLTASVSAFELDSDQLFITGMPTQAELANRTPVITLSAKKAESKDEIKELTGINTVNAGKVYKDGQDAYAVTVTISNIGDLACGYSLEGENGQTGVNLAGIQMSFALDSNIKAVALQKSEFPVDGSEIAIMSDSVALKYGNPADMSFRYPTFVGSDELGQILENPTITTTFAIGVTAGSKVTLTPTSTRVAYVHVEDGTTNLVPVDIKVDSVLLGKAAEPQSFNAKVPYGAKAQAATGIKFNLTTDDVTKNVKTVDYKVPFFKTEDDKSKIENIGNIAVGLTINDVPSGVTVKANSAELY